MPGATSTSPCTWRTFFQVGNVAWMRLASGRRASGSFSMTAGSVQNLYSGTETTISALGNTWTFVSFSISPRMWSGWKWEIITW